MQRKKLKLPTIKKTGLFYFLVAYVFKHLLSYEIYEFEVRSDRISSVQRKVSPRILIVRMNMMFIVYIRSIRA